MSNSHSIPPPLPKTRQEGCPSCLWLAWLASWALVAWGQPASSPPCLSLLAAGGAFGLFLWLLAQLSSAKARFLWGSLWFSSVQLVQLSWFTSHPFLYIWSVYLGLALLLGWQCGLFCLLVTRDRLGNSSSLLLLPALWVILEWLRLFFLSGFSWNPIGLALTAHPYPLQLASVAGVYGLSFWLMLTAVALAQALLAWTRAKPWGRWAALALLPYLLGMALWHHREAGLQEELASSPDRLWRVLLVQTAFSANETSQGLYQSSFEKWKTIATLIAAHQDRSIDLIALPEFAVPFPAYGLVYPYDQVKRLLTDLFGDRASLLPLPLFPLAEAIDQQRQLVVNNAFWAQALANCCQAPLVAGLEDIDYLNDQPSCFYSSALYFRPHPPQEPLPYPAAERYAKRVLVPMGEYIPWKWCSELASSYGVLASFTAGEQPTLFVSDKVAFAPTICYEETFGDLVTESKQLGAQALVNLTNDGWYPGSKLVRQHFDHARLRSVENGVPLVRACNTGLTCGVNSLGEVCGALQTEDGHCETLQKALYLEVPLYHYTTLYSITGDRAIVGLSLALFLLFRRRHRAC